MKYKLFVGQSQFNQVSMLYTVTKLSTIKFIGGCGACVLGTFYQTFKQ